MTNKVTALPSKGDKNEVKEKILAALESNYDEVFIIGVKDRMLHTSYSGYKDIESKLGALELLKFDLIEGTR